MWWAWNYEARNMFKALDEELYEEVGHNPVQLLERLSYDRKEAIVKDKKLMKQVSDVYKKFRTYMDVKPNKKRAFCCLLLYGVWFESGFEDLFWWSWYLGRRLH